MEFNHQYISVARIDDKDTTFRVSNERPVDALADNIQRFGLINPPILLEYSKRYVIISGFLRVAAARHLAWETIRARILPHSAPAMTCVQLAIIENTSQRVLNVIEQARAVYLLSNTLTDDNRLPSAAKDVGLEMSPNFTEKLLKVYHMAPTLQQGIACGAIALPSALRLQEIKTKSDIDALTALLMELNLSLNRQRQIIDWVEAIAHRDRQPIARFLNEKALLQIRRNGELDRRQKSARIREHIKKCRYPEIVQAEQRYKALAKQLPMPKNTQLQPPAYFEGNQYSLRVNFTSSRELIRFQTELSHLINTPAFDALLDPFD